jgi:hypothetical protein
MRNLMTMISTLTLAIALVGCGDANQPAKKDDKAAKADDKAKDAGSKDAGADKDAEATPPDPNSPEGKALKAAEVAAAIEAAPENADDILAKHKLDREQLDALMFEVASDPVAREAYKLARAKAA